MFMRNKEDRIKAATQVAKSVVKADKMFKPKILKEVLSNESIMLDFYDKLVRMGWYFGHRAHECHQSKLKSAIEAWFFSCSGTMYKIEHKDYPLITIDEFTQGPNPKISPVILKDPVFIETAKRLSSDRYTRVSSIMNALFKSMSDGMVPSPRDIGEEAHLMLAVEMLFQRIITSVTKENFFECGLSTRIFFIRTMGGLVECNEELYICSSVKNLPFYIEAIPLKEFSTGEISTIVKMSESKYKLLIGVPRSHPTFPNNDEPSNPYKNTGSA